MEEQVFDFSFEKSVVNHSSPVVQMFLRYLASSVIVEELEKSRQEASARAGKLQF